MVFLNVALPKGRLGEKVYAMFEAAGYECPSIKEQNRKLTFEYGDGSDWMERFKTLNRYQKCVLIIMAVMTLIFAVLYPITVAKVGVVYKGEVLVK